MATPLTSMLRPVKKTFGRLVFAGGNNAVGNQNSAFDQVRDVAFRDDQQVASPSEIDQILAQAAGSSAVSTASPSAVPAQTGFFSAGPVVALPLVAADPGMLGFRFSQSQQPVWAAAAQYTSEAVRSDSTSPAGSDIPADASMASDLPLPWHASRIPVSTIWYPVFMQPVAMQVSPATASTDVAAAEVTEVQQSKAAQPAALPGRTGASRRQRKRQRQLREAQELAQKQSQSASQPLAEVPQPEPQEAAIEDAAERASASPLSASSAAPAAVPKSLPMLFAREQSDTDYCSSKLSVEDATSETSSLVGRERLASEEGESEMVYYPPTPERTPGNSPRYSYQAGPAGAFWMQELPAAGPQPLVAPMEAHNGVYDFPMHLNGNAAPQAERGAAECDRIVAALSLDQDSDAFRSAVQFVIDDAWALATSPAGCRVVQRALATASHAEQLQIARALKGRVREAVMSPHANHVLQKCIETLPAESLQFIIDELQGKVVETARHRFGCRVLERIVEHCSPQQTEPLTNEILAGASQLARHTFGNFVVQHVLEHGTDAQKKAIGQVLHDDIQRLARHRVASHVVRAALAHGLEEDRQAIVDALREDPSELADLAHHHCGSFVVREMRRELRR